MKVRFDISEFVAAHGEAPRGYGMWCFCQPNEYHDDYSHMIFTGLYSACKKEAEAYFNKHNDVSCIIVMP